MKKSLFLFFLLLLGGCSTVKAPALTPDEPSSTTPSIQEPISANTDSEGLPEGSFAFNEYGNFFGEVYVRGYLKQEQVPEAFCEEPCAVTYDGLFLQVTDSGNEEFTTFLKKNQGNAYASGAEGELIGQIMIGCLEEGDIVYSNDSDEHGMAQQRITGQEASDFLAHQDPSRQMVVKLTRLPLSGGRGAPACYSHFYGIELVDSLNTSS